MRHIRISVTSEITEHYECVCPDGMEYDDILEAFDAQSIADHAAPHHTDNWARDISITPGDKTTEFPEVLQWPSSSST